VPLPLDDLDRLIIAQLQRDARQTNRALAEAAGVAPSTMLARVRRLEEAGVIRGYHAVVAAFIDAVWQLEETVGISLTTGTYDVLVHLSAADVTSLGERVLHDIASFDNVVAEHTALVLEQREKSAITVL
jgi:DNA-binding Lrp family transcriptional regulator